MCDDLFGRVRAGSGEKYEVADGFQWIVDFMRDGGCQAGSRRKFLGATQYVLEVSFTRSVMENQNHSNQPAQVIGHGCGTIFNRQKVTVTVAQHGVIGEPDYGAHRQHLVHGVFQRVVRGFTEDRKYLTDLLSPSLIQACARKPFSNRVQERNPALVIRGDDTISNG